MSGCRQANWTREVQVQLIDELQRPHTDEAGDDLFGLSTAENDQQKLVEPCDASIRFQSRPGTRCDNIGQELRR